MTRASFPSFVTRSLSLVAMASLLMLTGCAQEEPEPAEVVVEEPEPVRVVVPGQGLAIVDLPAALTVDETRDDFVLVPTDGSGGEMTIRTEAPERGGVNLVAAWQEHKEAVEAMTDGEYKGKAELVVPFGTAFQSRGRYTGEDGSAVEEVKVFMLHPSGREMIVVDYGYPATDDAATQARVEDHVFPIVGSLELVDETAPVDGDAMATDEMAADDTSGDAGV